MKSLRLLLILLSATFMVACSNEDEPELVANVEDLSSNELTGTLWISHPDNSDLIPGGHISTIASFEFFGSKKCIANCSLDYCADEPTIWFFESEYNKETNTGRLDFLNTDFTIIDNDLFITAIDPNGVPQIYRFTKDLNYEAPAKDCPLIGNWEGKCKGLPAELNATAYIKIIDNKRLLYYNNFLSDAGHRIILDYIFDGKTLSFINAANNHISFNLKGNKLIGENVTLTKK